MSNFSPETMPALERMRKAAETGEMPGFFEMMLVLQEIADNAPDIAPSNEDSRCWENSSTRGGRYPPRSCQRAAH